MNKTSTNERAEYLLRRCHGPLPAADRHALRSQNEAAYTKHRGGHCWYFDMADHNVYVANEDDADI